MASLKIYDLHTSTDLDAKARAVIYGGMSFGWIRPYTDNQSSPSFGTTIIGQIQVFNTFLINPTYNTVNQLEFVTIDVTENVDSLISVDVAQGQAGRSNSFPFPM